MNRRLKKVLLLLLAAAFLFGAGQVQKVLNRDRDQLGLTRGAVLENAPPMLAFTTVALGGFRGLIANFLWMRADTLQQDDKFFEATQLADWITKLEPTFAPVWVFQGWNMAYNISVKFKDYPDRWRWLQRGIELMRDEGLAYNPNSVDIYRELAWQFQHKMGQNLDDANLYYKAQWAQAMTPFFGPSGTNFAPLLHPATAEETNLVAELRTKFKLDPVFAKQVDEKYGPFDWRLPEAHAIYWGARGLDAATRNPGKVKADDLIKLRRIIYQSMLQAFHHGRILAHPYEYPLGPNLELVGRVNDIYVQLHQEETDPGQAAGILRAQRNFLRDAIYFLYEANRMAEAAQWFKYLGEKFPNQPIIENQPDSLPKNLTLDEYAVAVVQIDVNETSPDRVTAAVYGLLAHAYISLIEDDDARAQNFFGLARRVYENYTGKTAKYNKDRIALPPFETLRQTVVQDLLDPQQGRLPYAARAVLRTRLGKPPETAAPAPAPGNTNKVETPATPPNSTNSATPPIT